MKNLTKIDVEKVEDLPKRGKYLKDYDYYHHKGHPFPYRIIPRFLESRVGYLWEDVVSEFIHKSWVPAAYRTYSNLRSSPYLEVDTFMQNSKVMYVSNNKELSIEDVYRDTYYVHPTTHRLCFQKKKKCKRVKYPVTFIHLGEWHQLCKQDGIWYEVTLVKLGSDINRCYSEKHELIPYCSEFSLWERRIWRCWLPPIFRKRQLNHEELKKYRLKNELPWTVEQRKKWIEEQNKQYV